MTLRLRGDGPLGGVIADAGLDGAVRGYVNQPNATLPPRPDGKLNVGGALGRGDLQVIRAHAPYGDPYSSSVDLVTGEIAEDITVFFGAVRADSFGGALRRVHRALRRGQIRRGDLAGAA